MVTVRLIHLLLFLQTSLITSSNASCPLTRHNGTQIKKGCRKRCSGNDCSSTWSTLCTQHIERLVPCTKATKCCRTFKAQLQSFGVSAGFNKCLRDHPTCGQLECMVFALFNKCLSPQNRNKCIVGNIKQCHIKGAVNGNTLTAVAYYACNFTKGCEIRKSGNQQCLLSTTNKKINLLTNQILNYFQRSPPKSKCMTSKIMNGCKSSSPCFDFVDHHLKCYLVGSQKKECQITEIKNQLAQYGFDQRFSKCEQDNYCTKLQCVAYALFSKCFSRTSSRSCIIGHISCTDVINAARANTITALTYHICKLTKGCSMQSDDDNNVSPLAQCKIATQKKKIFHLNSLIMTKYAEYRYLSFTALKSHLDKACKRVCRKDKQTKKIKCRASSRHCTEYLDKHLYCFVKQSYQGRCTVLENRNQLENRKFASRIAKCKRHKKDCEGVPCVVYGIYNGCFNARNSRTCIVGKISHADMHDGKKTELFAAVAYFVCKIMSGCQVHIPQSTTRQYQTNTEEEGKRIDNVQINRAGLKRSFKLGQLYDASRDLEIEGADIWSSKTIEDHTKIIENEKGMDYILHKSTSYTDKMEHLQVGAELTASFIAGMVTVKGSAKYLNAKAKSSSHIEATYQLHIDMDRKELRTDGLDKLYINPSPVERAKLIRDRHATHYVSSIDYAIDAIFHFQLDTGTENSEMNVGATFGLDIKRIMFSARAEGGGDFNSTDLSEFTDVTCRFYCDCVETPPTTLEEAMETFKELTRKAKDEAENKKMKGRPYMVTLVPVSQLNTDVTNIINEIDAGLLLDIRNRMDKYVRFEHWIQDLKISNAYKNFKEFEKDIDHIEDAIMKVHKLKFLQGVKEILPEARKTNYEELGQFLGESDRNYKMEELENYLQVKLKEANVLKAVVVTDDEDDVEATYIIMFNLYLYPSIDDFPLCVMNQCDLKTTSPDECSKYDCRKHNDRFYKSWAQTRSVRKKIRACINNYDRLVEHNKQVRDPFVKSNSLFILRSVKRTGDTECVIEVEKELEVVEEDFSCPKIKVTKKEQNDTGVFFGWEIDQTKRKENSLVPKPHKYSIIYRMLDVDDYEWKEAIESNFGNSTFILFDKAKCGGIEIKIGIYCTFGICGSLHDEHRNPHSKRTCNCKKFPSIENGQIGYNGLTEDEIVSNGAMASITCDDGYYAESHNRVTVSCNSGKWTPGPISRCILACHKLDKLMTSLSIITFDQNKEREDHILPGGTAQFFCKGSGTALTDVTKKHFLYIGRCKSVLKCRNDGTWMDFEPVSCIPVCVPFEVQLSNNVKIPPQIRYFPALENNDQQYVPVSTIAKLFCKSNEKNEVVIIGKLVAQLKCDASGTWIDHCSSPLDCFKYFPSASTNALHQHIFIEPSGRRDVMKNGYETAEQMCNNVCSQIVSLSSEAEGEAVRQLCDAAVCWVGLKLYGPKLNRPPEFWEDGTPTVWLPHGITHDVRCTFREDVCRKEHCYMYDGKGKLVYTRCESHLPDPFCKIQLTMK